VSKPDIRRIPPLFKVFESFEGALNPKPHKII
jgi:hypothetical protein